MVLHFDNMEPLIIGSFFVFALPLLVISFCHEPLVLLIIIVTLRSHINVLVLRMGLQRLSAHLIGTRRRLCYTITMIMSSIWHVGVIVSDIRIATICRLKLLILDNDLRQLPRITERLLFLGVHLTTARRSLILTVPRFI